MAEKHDVIVIGGGHNGLVAAAYLAKAGLDVCVVEKSAMAGGACWTTEFSTPGFRHDPCASIHAAIQGNPLIRNDELGLMSKYGLKYVFSSNEDPRLAVVFSDNSSLLIYGDMERTCQSIAQFSRKDAEAYPRFASAWRDMQKVAGIALFSTAPPFGKLVSLLDSNEYGREYFRVLMSSAVDVAQEWFESEKVQIAICRFASEWMMAPHELETGYAVAAFATMHAPRANAIPEGGAGKLIEALESSIKDLGGSVKVKSGVKSVMIKGGEAQGVVLESGEEILANKAVISAVNIKQLVLQMLSGEGVPQGIQGQARHVKQNSYSGMNQLIALNEPPKYKAGDAASRAVLVEITPSSMDELLMAFDQYRYGVANGVMPSIICQTLVDPTRAPTGKHTLYLYHYAPYRLKGGATQWDKVKQSVGDEILKTLQKHTSNMGPENIIGRHIMSPLDFERHDSSLVEGDFMHVGARLSQFFSNRPMAGWGQNKTPIKKLYVCGASTHPGGAITGNGRTVAQVLMEDLGIDFKKVVPR